MSPKPRPSLNHFTVPVARFIPLRVCELRDAEGATRKRLGKRGALLVEQTLDPWNDSSASPPNCRFRGRARVRTRAALTEFGGKGANSEPATTRPPRAKRPTDGALDEKLDPRANWCCIAQVTKTSSLAGTFQSGRQDLNLRPPGPQPGALPDCATPRGEQAGDGNRTRPRSLEGFCATTTLRPQARPILPALLPRGQPVPARVAGRCGRTSGPSTPARRVCSCPTGPWSSSPGSRSATTCCGTGR